MSSWFVHDFICLHKHIHKWTTRHTHTHTHTPIHTHSKIHTHTNIHSIHTQSMHTVLIYTISMIFLGYYCNNGPLPVSNLTGYECPAGYYCPVQTEHASQYPCAPGSCNNRTGITSQSECYQCPPRYYCKNPGLSQPEGLCFAG